MPTITFRVFRALIVVLAGIAKLGTGLRTSRPGGTRAT
jgi:hypothetical protein